MTAAEPRRFLHTVGWFLLGFAWLWLVSTLVDATLSSLAGVTEVLARSASARVLFLLVAAFLAAVIAIAVARLHARWGAETLRAAWIVGAIDVVLGLAAAMGLRGNARPLASFAEGFGFLMAAGVFALLGVSPRLREAGRAAGEAESSPATKRPPGSVSR